MQEQVGEDAPALWSQAPDQALQALRAGVQGLSEDEAARRLADVGPNCLPEAPRRSILAMLVGQLKEFLILLLIGAAVLALSVGQTEDAVVIGCVVVFNAVLGFVQEYRAEAAVAALRGMLSPTARVRRGGRERQVDAESLVPGDVVLLEAGDRVPADGRLLVAHALEVDESSLTGESVPVAKRVEPLPAADLPLGDRVNLGFMNTVVTRGRGELLVAHTGADTEMGRLATLLTTGAPQDTPLQLQVAALGRRLAAIAGVAVLLITTLELLRGRPLADVLMQAVAIAVAAIPEGLPAVVTVTLALGMRRMARENAIVRRMSSVETLGCTTDICSDKTGTLTLNQMTAREVLVSGRRLEVTGEGYELDGAIEGAGEDPALAPLLEVAALCNDSAVREGEIAGDPTEAALWVLAAKGGVDVVALRADAPRMAEVPFDASRRFSATVHGDRLLAKGALDVLAERCDRNLGPEGPTPFDDEALSRIGEAHDQMAARGLRVLALAGRAVEPALLPASPDDLADEVRELTLYGLVGLLDPPRAEARAAIAACREAGIRVRMITGDHATTGLAVARALGIEGEAVSGRDLDRLTPEALAGRLPDLGVLARVSPEHKLDVVEALRARGGVVAMIGDGVNDAPALERADIGVAMGVAGTEVTKQAANLILADDNFATIVGAVREGRTIYDNIVRFLRFQLSTNMGALLTVFLAPLLGLPAPFTAVQILWVNLIMDGPPAMALGVDPPHPDIMRQPPRDPRAHILTWRRLAVLLWFGAIMAAGTLSVLAFAPGTPAERRTLAFTTFVLFQVVNVFNARFERRSALGRHALVNGRLWLALAAVLALQVAVVHTGPLQRLLDAVPLAPSQWLLAAGVASTVLVAEEIRKLLR